METFVAVCVCSDEAEGAVRRLDYRITGITQQPLLFDLSKMVHINSQSHTLTLRSHLKFTFSQLSSERKLLPLTTVETAKVASKSADQEPVGFMLLLNRVCLSMCVCVCAREQSSCCVGEL